MNLRGWASVVLLSNKRFEHGFLHGGRLLLPDSKSFSLRTVFENAIAGCFVVGVRDDHSPVVVLAFVLIFGCGHDGNFTILESSPVPPRLHIPNVGIAKPRLDFERRIRDMLREQCPRNKAMIETKRKRIRLLLLVVGCVLVVLAVFVYNEFTIFVVQPIGALPNGATAVIWRTGKLNFIDSADGFCARESGGVSLLCRGAVLAAVAKNNQILLRLPYSEALYEVSTDGKTYEK
jgi:hypothetical protein